MIDTQGVYELPMAEYQADPCQKPSLSSGIAHTLFTQSPLHAWHGHPRLNPNHKTEHANVFDLGSCAHSLLLEDESGIVEVHFDDWKKKPAQEQRDEARANGKIPVLSRKLSEVRQMASVAKTAIANSPDLEIDLAAGKVEHVFAWQERNVWCRARPDWHRVGLILDYKSTAGRAEPNAWMRNQMVPLGYDMQAAHYTRGYTKTVAKQAPQWVFLVQENYPPYACAFVGLSPAMREIAERKWQQALALWEACLERNIWNGYSLHVAYAEPTTWQMDDDEERRLTFEERLEFALA